MKDVNEVLNELGMGKYQWAQLVMVGMLSLLDGAEILLASSVLESLEVQWNIGSTLKGAFVSVIFIGVLIGNAIGSAVADSVGRRPVTLASYAGVCVCGLLSSQAIGPMTLLAARFAFGIAYGLNTSTGITLLVESVPAAWRGYVVNFLGLFFMCGEIFAAILLMVFMPHLGLQAGGNTWRWVTALGTTPGLLALPVVFFMIQESPHFLMAKGRQAEALAVLRNIAVINNCESSLQDLTALRSDQAGGPQVSGGTGEADPVEASSSSAAQEQRCETSLGQRLEMAMSPDYRLTIFGGAYILFVSNFVFFGLMYALPNIFAHMNLYWSPAFQVLIVSVIDLPAFFLAWVLISSQFGHRDGLVTLAMISASSFLIMTTLDLGEAMRSMSLPVTYLAKYASSAFFTLSYVYLAEIFPSAIRTTCMGLCIMAGRLGSIIAPPIFEILSADTEHWLFFVLCAIITGFAVIVIRLTLLHELKNKPLQDVPITKKDTGKDTGMAPLVAPAADSSRTEMASLSASS